ncbi:DUF6544 family protein [Desulfuribacillus alkaliarsenatis]|uniref:Uncharacterized protein n=1 Tax=Desulfuribacillus alkaliarsenatis TaxID=766136 RepID=A0A1E5FYM2_9FIRM|nr:DUF6544 family protein [Desulfuribacillus alkaliarsenatis]OEF95674.1 hypothetical protein BHF68_11240 [Desulfuribacillus alkaliarsenatis]
MLKVFEEERQEEIARLKDNTTESFFTKETIADLPDPIKKYMHATGYINKPIMYNADVVWKESYIKLQPDKDWSQLETRQFNSINPIVRIAYMKFLTMPVTGRDIYRDGIGEMKGKLFNFIPIINGKGKEVSQSSLITVFCEFLFIPSYILGDYVTWETVDKNTVKARLINNGFDVTGLFHFDDEGLFTRFETNDRYYGYGKKSKKVKFSAIVDSYQVVDDIKIPLDVRIVWHSEEGDYEYYKGTIEKIVFNVNQ